MNRHFSNRPFSTYRRRVLGALVVLVLSCLSLSACADYAPRSRPDLPPARYYSHPFNPGKAGSTASFETEVQYCVTHSVFVETFLNRDQYKEVVKSWSRTVNGVKVYPRPTTYALPLVEVQITRLRDGKVVLQQTEEVYRLRAAGDKSTSFIVSGIVLEPGIYRVEAKAMRDAPMFDRDENQIELSIYWNTDLKGLQKCTN
jgi:hypothetical protein